MPSRGRRLGPCEVATSGKPHYLWSLLRPETAFFFETRPNIDAFSSSQPVLPYPPQEMFDFQLFNQVVGQSITELLHPFGQVPVLIGGTSGEAATFMKYCLTIWTYPSSNCSPGTTIFNQSWCWVWTMNLSGRLWWTLGVFSKDLFLALVPTNTQMQPDNSTLGKPSRLMKWIDLLRCWPIYGSGEFWRFWMNLLDILGGVLR